MIDAAWPHSPEVSAVLKGREIGEGAGRNCPENTLSCGSLPRAEVLTVVAVISRSRLTFGNRT